MIIYPLPKSVKNGHTKTEENKLCLAVFLIITIIQVIVTATAFFASYLFYSSETSTNRKDAIIITSCGVIIARYDVILNKSERAHFYNHLSNYTKARNPRPIRACAFL